MADVVLKNEAGEDVTYSGVAGINLLNADGTTSTFTQDNCICNKGAVPYGKELPYTWAELSEIVKTGDFTGINIGDYKTITLDGGETVVCEVAGIDTYYNRGYENAPGSGYYPCDQHHIDFISRDCLTTTDYVIYNDVHEDPETGDWIVSNNGTSAQKNPFMASQLYQTLNNTTDGLITKLPADLRNIIINKQAYMEARYSSSALLDKNSGMTWCNMGPLWLPTEFEVWGRHTYSEAGPNGVNSGCNIQYPIFKNGLQHILKGYGNAGGVDSWWLASAAVGGSDSFCCVGSDGYAGYDTADFYCLVPLCFRIG